MGRVKILYLDRNGKELVGAPRTQYEFMQEVSKLTDCAFSDSFSLDEKLMGSINKAVRDLMPDADWVIDADNNLHNPKPKKRTYHLSHFVSDLHGKHAYQVGVEEHIDLLNKAKYDCIFYRYPELHGTEYRPRTYLGEVKSKSFFVPWSVDVNKFKPNIKKDIDVAFVGAVSNKYPLRKTVYEVLKNGFHGYKVHCSTSPLGKDRRIKDFVADYPVGWKYKTLLSRSKVLIFSSSIFRYPLQKYFEGTASGCLVMSSSMCRGDKLGFVDDVSYVEINEENWVDRLLYYLENDEERKRIASNGLLNTRRNHSHEKRAQQFVRILNGYKKN